VNAVGIALNAPLTLFAEERVWVFRQKPQANCPHLMLELKLHVEFHGVAAKPNLVRWIGFVPQKSSAR
jgi:hypothetical protein